MKPRQCCECGHQFQGRSDKKFCTDQCRTSHHNRHNRTTLKYTRQINRILSRNRRILQTLQNQEQQPVRVTKSKLNLMGFNFTYFTHIHRTPTGEQYYFCYEHGYLPLENGYFALISKSDAGYV